MSTKKSRELRDTQGVIQNNICAYCDIQMTAGSAMTDSRTQISFEHILPQTFGGCDDELNVLAICHNCNQNRGHRALSLRLLVKVLKIKGPTNWLKILGLHIRNYVGILSTMSYDIKD